MINKDKVKVEMTLKQFENMENKINELQNELDETTDNKYIEFKPGITKDNRFIELNDEGIQKALENEENVICKIKLSKGFIKNNFKRFTTKQQDDFFEYGMGYEYDNIIFE